MNATDTFIPVCPELLIMTDDNSSINKPKQMDVRDCVQSERIFFSASEMS